MAFWFNVIVFDAFARLAVPFGIFGVLVLLITPGLDKLVVLMVFGNVLWATFYVAKGFAIADFRRDE